jgi:acyl-CoA thioester hydrolase
MSELIKTWSGPVDTAWVDYNGHLRDAFYLLIFSFASDGLMEMIGLDDAGRKATGHTFYALETHLNYLLEVKAGVPVEVRTQILAVDKKRVDVYHTLNVQGSDTVLAANEQMLINIDSSGPKSAPFAPQVESRLRALFDQHRALARPAFAGRTIAMPT